ncbi:LamG domain-containing protein [Aquimarina agarilytica]|uniref:beta-agarase n=1 Tax=Aquimarina agarilytica TaxID=1087449 RepID=UPI00028A1AE5|nr:beta-agarase [Aquimarina agarilytica]
MNNLSFFKKASLLIATLTTLSTFAQPTPPKGESWKMLTTLSDEFDTWDDTKWRKVLWDYPAPNKMKDENAGVSNGKLWIKASIASDTDTERWFETSRIYSKAQISYPMYIECSMKTAHISAYNTFWLNNGNAEGRDEIDICENMSNPINKEDADLAYVRQSQYFIVENSEAERSKEVFPEIEDNHTRIADFDNRKLSNNNPAKGKKWNEDYQTFGLYWKDAYTMIYYINGEKSGVDISKTPFTRKLDVIWDLWTQNHDGGLETKERMQSFTEEERTMYIDYVHTYTYAKK